MAMSRIWRAVLLAAAVAVTAAQNRSHYCAITPDHTLCQFEGPGPACDQLYLHPVNSTDAMEIVYEHNRLRAKVAKGREKRGGTRGQPPASNMRLLTWDDELARVAQRHAEQCQFIHDCQLCRKVERFMVGQNVFNNREKQPRNNHPDWKQAVNSWYDEVTMFDPQNIKPFVFQEPVGHYTQLVWAETTHIGCGYSMYWEDNYWWSKLYVCNYGPAGNWVNGQMYKRNRPCRSCPAGTSCSSSFPGLCQ